MIRFENIYLKYNNKTIFEDFTFNINRNDKIVITGKSGIGKSSLFHLLLGFVVPDKGKIYFEENEIDHKNIWEIRKNFAYVDQDVFIPDTAVKEYINFVFSIKQNHKLFNIEKLKSLFEHFEFDFNDIYNKSTSKLSGGERQRIALIVAIMLNRKIFLLDEATSALDSHLKTKVVDYFINQKDKTVIAISHDPQWLGNNIIKKFDLAHLKEKQYNKN